MAAVVGVAIFECRPLIGSAAKTQRLVSSSSSKLSRTFFYLKTDIYIYKCKERM